MRRAFVVLGPNTIEDHMLREMRHQGYRRAAWRDTKLSMAMWLAERLPKRLRYAVVIMEACHYSWEHTEAEVPAITAVDITKNLLEQLS